MIGNLTKNSGRPIRKQVDIRRCFELEATVYILIINPVKMLIMISSDYKISSNRQSSRKAESSIL